MKKTVEVVKRLSRYGIIGREWRYDELEINRYEMEFLKRNISNLVFIAKNNDID